MQTPVQKAQTHLSDTDLEAPLVDGITQWPVDDSRSLDS